MSNAVRNGVNEQSTYAHRRVTEWISSHENKSYFPHDPPYFTNPSLLK